jgi:hypothetical protein
MSTAPTAHGADPELPSKWSLTKEFPAVKDPDGGPGAAAERLTVGVEGGWVVVRLMTADDVSQAAVVLARATDPKQPGHLLTPNAGHAFVYVCTIQRPAYNLLGPSAVFEKGGDGGSKPTAVLLSIAASVKRHGLDPWAHPTYVLSASPTRSAEAGPTDLPPDAGLKTRSQTRHRVA